MARLGIVLLLSAWLATDGVILGDETAFLPVSKRRPEAVPAPYCPAPGIAPPLDPTPSKEPEKRDAPPPVEPATRLPPIDMLAGATETGAQPGAQYNPVMFGDLFGISSNRFVTIPGRFIQVPVVANFSASSSNTVLIPSTVVTNNIVTTINNNTTITQIINPSLPPPPPTVTTNTTTSTQQQSQTQTQNVPTTQTSQTNGTIIGVTQIPLQVASRGVPIAGQYNGFKISENETPRPIDRVYVTYNYWNDVNRSTLPAELSGVDIQRQMFGFEKTFFGGDVSVGMRLPYFQVFGLSDTDSQIIGDLNLLAKLAWINDPETGNVFSTGFVLTMPTGSGGPYLLADGTLSPHSTLFQPWAGWIYNFDRFYTQGFLSLVVPSDDRDPTIAFTSLGAGYWAYRDPNADLLRGVVPVAELHFNNPLNHRSPSDMIYFQDQINMTMGVYTILGRLTVGAAVGVPLVGPRPFDVEAITSLNLRF
jgi:hypothetical protein